LMGGQIWLESEPGVGSAFTFTAWLGVGQAQVRKIIPEKLTHLRVLIVDDNSAAREIIDDLVGDIVHQTDSVASAEEAMAAIRQHDGGRAYDVVFMDWRMPGMDGLQAARAIKGEATLKHPPAIIMVTAFGREEVRDEAERLNLDGFLVKPVTKSMVVDALINVFVEASDQAAAVSAAKSEGVQLTGMRILLVEDNDINQQIAVELLEGVGAKVTVTNHGREAVELLRQGPAKPAFDVVLMDLQMPEMDGHQATAHLRADARFEALPIIAMTAHATVEERDYCLAHGMNGHLAKPIEPAVLFATLAQLNRPRGTLAPFPERPSRTNTLPAIEGLDTADGLARVAGNETLYRKLLQQFIEQQAATMAEIPLALARGDVATAARLAHTLKGVAGNLGARQVQAASDELEKRIREGGPGQDLAPVLRKVSATLEPLVSAVRVQLSPPPGASATAPAVDPAQARAIARQLLELLTGYDAGAAAFAEANQDRLRPLFEAARWTQFLQHMQGFAFPEARNLLEDAMVRRPG
jgi:two-component system sensor histidine kinase/response regulator